MPPHEVLKHVFPMIGVDYHIPWPPGSPSPAPSPAPYSTFSILNGLGLQCKKATTEFSDSFGLTMKQGTDIGMMIPHIGVPSITLPIEMLASASKSHFGSAQHMVGGDPCACALLFFTNPNLNCGTPWPTPTGFVMCFTRHMVDMTWGEIIGGLFSMAFDAVAQRLLYGLGNRIGAALGPRLASPMISAWGTRMGGAYARAMAGRFEAAGLEFGSARFLSYMRGAGAVYAENMASTVTGTAIGFLTGGPLGADAATVGGWTPAGAATDAGGGVAQGAGDSLGNMIDGGRSPNQPTTSEPG